MKKISREGFDLMGWDEQWQHISALQTELETRGQGMAGADVHDWLIGQGWDNEDLRDIPDRLIEDLAKLTVPQGFVVTDEMWKKAPKNAEGIAIIWNGVGKNCATFSHLDGDDNALISFILRPLPTKVERARTREEKIHALKSYLQTPVVKMFESMNDSVLDANCLLANIHLTVLEEV